VYKSPKITDKEKDKPTIAVSGTFSDAPCKCIEVENDLNSFTLTIDQSKLTPEDSGEYDVKVTLTDKHFADT
jgi:hypothetical protein